MRRAAARGGAPVLAFAAKLPPLDVQPEHTANGTTRRHAFTENDAPIALTSPTLLAGATSGGAPLVRAVVRLTNPVDAPLEGLDVTNSYRTWLETYADDKEVTRHENAEAHVSYERRRVGPGVDVVAVAKAASDPISWRGRVYVTFDKENGVLVFDAPLVRGESTLDSNDAPTTHALRDALRNVTYSHVGKKPDPATRGVEFVITDVEGVSSAPASTLIDVFPVNDPPVIDVNGFHVPGLDRVVSFGERERRLGVRLVSSAAEVSDPDGDTLKRLFVRYDRLGDGTFADFPDGDAERIEADVSGTSITKHWNASSFTLELTGVDTLESYRTVLTSARYTHIGLVREIPNQSPATTEMAFTEGNRTFVVIVEDMHGATANATVFVNVKDTERVGDPRRDVNQATPAECSGYGLTKLTIARADALAALDYSQSNTPGLDVESDPLAFSELVLSNALYDPEECVCEPGYEGEQCEVHPCGAAWRGELVSYDAANDLKTCACAEFFTGRTCDVECWNNGVFVKQGTDEGGRDGVMGTAGVAIPEDQIGACVCDPGFAGNVCGVACPGCDGAHAKCVLLKEYARLNNYTNPDGSVYDGSGDTDLDYAEQSWTCVCSDDYMGELCDIPCPCAGFGLAHGACEVDEAKRLSGAFANDELGKCACDSTHTGEDCSVPCPPCTLNQGDCAPPVGYEAGVGAAVAAIYADITLSPAEKLAFVEAAKVDGKCFCREETNAVGGWSYFGDDCAVPCRPCVHGFCGVGGACVCHPGFSGETCDLECGGRGVLAFPTFHEDAVGHRRVDFDRLPGVAGNDTTANSGLFDANALYGMTRGDVDHFNLGATGVAAAGSPASASGDDARLDAYCACGMRRVDSSDPFGSELRETVPGANDAGGVGFTGVFCDVPCAACNYDTGACVWDGVDDVARCKCDETTQNVAMSLSPLVPADESGVGYAGEDCSIPCVPCKHGSCGREAHTHGLCVCDPGFSDPACAVECGAPGETIAWSAVVFQNFETKMVARRAEEARLRALEGTSGDSGDADGAGTAGDGDGASGDGATPATPATEEDDYEFSTLPDEEDEPEMTPIGSRGKVNYTGAPPGLGIGGSTVTCECELGWTGPTCAHACPFPHDREHGVCAVKDPGDDDYGAPWTAEIVCAEGFAGTPEDSKFSLKNYEETYGAQLSRGRDCATKCSTCVYGTCQDDGTCVCDYDAIWQGPLSEQTAERRKAETGLGVKHPTYPFPTQREHGYDAYDPAFHGCVAKHPCNNNGELFNATCGVDGRGFVDNHTAWTDAPASGGGGWGCDGELVRVDDGAGIAGDSGSVDDYVSEALGGGSVSVVPKYVCVDPVTKKPDPSLYKFAMAYARWDAETRTFLRVNYDLTSHDTPGLVQGGYCEASNLEDLEPDGQPLRGGYCVCDSLRNGRFKHPSARAFESGGYDFFFQGWAGETCDTPCAPCSENGLCDALSGACVCHPGWNGYRCLTPCEPCDHGTCQYDGTCLCDGPRRARDGEYALRLTRDPFFLEKGDHAFDVRGFTRERYVHASYATTAEVEDYVWELEYECPNRVECLNRASDATHLPTRPNETYFRYTSPDVLQVEAVNRELATMRRERDGLVTDIEGVPDSMATDEVCDEVNDRNEVTKGACLERMRNKVFGRTADGCGKDWDAVRPWLCDDVVKAHFVRERNRKLGVMEVQYLRLQQTTEAENVWFANNVNERQRLINAVRRGVFNASAGVENFQTKRDPDYYVIWILHQLIHGVVSGDTNAYTGWNCAVRCDACDPEHGTCNYDGTCECAPGWYGARCDRRCDCFRHVAVKNALELKNLADDVELETVMSHSGYAIRPHGTCRRDGTCACYEDEDGTKWTGPDCFTKCAPCNNGACGEDGRCVCREGWTGETCDTPTFTECLPCDDTHGVCLSDGTCKCDKGWTGLDCSIECSPCLHGDCRLDGSCHCRPGWTLLDCSKFIDLEKGVVVRSDFALGPEGWRVHNNSCLGVLDHVDGDIKGLYDVLASLGYAPERDAYEGYRDASSAGARFFSSANATYSMNGTNGDSPALGSEAYRHAATRGACHDDGDGGDAGLEWDGSSGYLYLTDRLPGDDAKKGELAFFRAPGKFLGDVFADAYNGTLTYELYLAGGGDALRNAGATPTTPHEPGSAEFETPDVYLIGGAPRVGLEIPPWDAWSKTRVVEWSRTKFPELKLDARWAKARVVATVEAYLDAPQIVLGIKAPRVRYYPPEVCLEEHCALNFAFDLHENAGWMNYPTIPAGFGWADVRVSENLPSQATGGDAGNLKRDPSSYTVETTEYVGEDYGVSTGQNAYSPFGAFPDVAALVAAGAYVDEGTPLLETFSVSDPALTANTRPNGGVANAVGDSSGGKIKKYEDDAKRRWDLYPEVYAAIRANRARRDGTYADFAEVAWCLSSLTEMLIKADYHKSLTSTSTERGFIGNLASTNRATGAGETVRLDHVIVARRDSETEPSKWIAKEHAKFLEYANLYAEAYKSMFLAEYFTVNAEILRLSICHGNGVYVDGDAENGCACDPGFVGAECEGTCPSCSSVGTKGGEFFYLETNGGCVLDHNPTSASLAFLESIGALEEARGGAPTKCVCEEGFAGLLCDQPCLPCAGGSQECVTSPATGEPACECPDGKAGAYCHLYCPPCDFSASKCTSTSYIGAYPGTNAICECDDQNARTGVTCRLRCPGDVSTNYCGNGRCTHTLEGVAYEDTTASMRAMAFAFCECDLGYVGQVCQLPCPGSLNHPTRPGPYPCLGRGACGIGVGGDAACVCVDGYAGDLCDTPRNVCGDGVVNSNEQCDDGNALIGDGCDDACVVEEGWACTRSEKEDVTRVTGVAVSYVSTCVPAEDAA